MTTLDAFDPTWPNSLHTWAVFAFSLALAIFKLDRGTLMWRRSSYVDRFGASIITFDLVMGATFLIVAAQSLYPRLQQSETVFWSLLLPLGLAMFWQWIEIRLATRERVHVAVAGVPVTGSTWQPGDPDRRSGKPGRRVTDHG